MITLLFPNGVVHEIFYKSGESAPQFTNCVWVDFGDKYKGSAYEWKKLMWLGSRTSDYNNLSDSSKYDSGV